VNDYIAAQVPATWQGTLMSNIIAEIGSRDTPERLTVMLSGPNGNKGTKAGKVCIFYELTI
jgi:hypothetical protein